MRRALCFCPGPAPARAAPFIMQQPQRLARRTVLGGPTLSRTRVPRTVEAGPVRPRQHPRAGTGNSTFGDRVQCLGRHRHFNITTVGFVGLIGFPNRRLLHSRLKDGVSPLKPGRSFRSSPADRGSKTRFELPDDRAEDATDLKVLYRIDRREGNHIRADF